MTIAGAGFEPASLGYEPNKEPATQNTDKYIHIEKIPVSIYMLSS